MHRMSMLRRGRWNLAGMFFLSMALPAQTVTTIYNFGSQGHDGVNPKSHVIVGPQGQLYGTTAGGGELNYGTVYELMPPVSAGGVWTEVVLHSFNGPDGQDPCSAPLLGPNGALYGVTRSSTSEYQAMAFELDPPTDASTHWSYRVIHQFPFVTGRAYPSGALAFGTGQSLYGVTLNTVYSLTPPSPSGGAWTETTLFTFPSGHYDSYALGTLAVSGNGTLFGANAALGSGRCIEGCGLVFSLTPPGAVSASWTYRVLHEFGAQAGDGLNPSAGVILTPTGVLYGTTENGGAGSMGTVFALTPGGLPGAPMTETILHAFSGSDGGNPEPGVLAGPNGVLYGSTPSGGANGHGTVYVLIPPTAAGGSWTETVLYNFTGGADGSTPVGLALGSDGTLYGTTNVGGTFNEGTVFTIKF